MENLIKDLDNILELSHIFKAKYQKLKDKNTILEVQLSNLKVEADQYKNQINLLQKALEESEAKDKNAMLSVTDELSEVVITDAILADSTKNAEIKKQLDLFIDDIDECIQLVQKKE